jgi:hypothetical protein
MNNVSPENLQIYNNIFKEELNACRKHQVTYNLSYHYDARYDAVGLTYYRILEKHHDNKELVEHAKNLFLK